MIDLSKIILGFLVILASAGCGRSPQTADPTPETTPWLFPQKQIEMLREQLAQVDRQIETLQDLFLKANEND